MRKDPGLFAKFYRMTPDKFDKFHNIVRMELTKEYLPVPSGERLAITVRYLSSGSPLKYVALAFRLSPETCRRIVHHACRVLWAKLKPLYLSVPLCQQWQNVALGFQTWWNFPNCLGAVDGKHVHITAPPPLWQRLLQLQENLLHSTDGRGGCKLQIRHGRCWSTRPTQRRGCVQGIRVWSATGE